MAWLNSEKRDDPSTLAGMPTSTAIEPELLSLEEVAREMGPFAPPPDYEFEPELTGPPPRSVPADCRRAPAARRVRRNAISCLLMALACLAFARAHFVQDLAYYLLPLGYLSYIGAGLVAIGAMMLGSFYFPSGPIAAPFKYIKRGQPVVAQVLAKRNFISKVKTHGSTMVRFGFETGVQLLHPEKGRIENVWVRSEEIGSGGDAKRFREPYEVGDYVTLVYLPGKFDKTARIYSMLGVSATAPYIEKDGGPWQRGLSVAMTLIVTGLVIAGFGMLLSGIYAVEFRSPIEENGSALFRKILPAAVVLGPLLGFGFWKLLHRANREGGTRVKFAWVWAILGGLVGGMLGSWLLVTFINSGLDRSPPQYQEFEVINFWEETHDGVIRTYEIEYQPLKGGKPLKYPARHDEMQAFSQLMAGVAEVHRGYLGLPWVRHLYPMRFELKGDLDSQPAAGAELASLLQFTVRVEGDKSIPASRELMQRILAKMAAQETEKAFERHEPATAPAFVPPYQNSR